MGEASRSSEGQDTLPSGAAAHCWGISQQTGQTAESGGLPHLVFETLRQRDLWRDVLSLSLGK